MCVRVCVCVCVCVSVKSHLTSEASVRRENVGTYSAGNEGQKICGVFSETAPLPRSSTIFPADNALCIRKFSKVRDVMLGLHAVSSPWVLYNFTRIILGLELELCILLVIGLHLSIDIERDCSPAIPIADSAE